MFYLPGGDPRTLGGGLGVALGALGAFVGGSGGVFWRLRGDLGGGRAGGLKMRRFLVVFWSDFGGVFVDFSCLLGASPALFFCRVCV